MSLIRNLMDAVSENLISGNAYYLIIKSAFVTIGITLTAWIVTFLIGGLLSYFMCYRKRLLSGLANGLCFLLRSAPAPLLLLFFYYVLCKKAHSGTMLLAGVALGFWGAGHFAEIIAHSVRGAQRRQDEAVTARLGHLFYSVALPQAVEESWFPIKRLTIHLLQWTTVAGYLGVNDLSAVLERIGQRTSYPFFSLFFSILFYLILTVGVEFIFYLLAKHFAPNEAEG